MPLVHAAAAIALAGLSALPALGSGGEALVTIALERVGEGQVLVAAEAIGLDVTAARVTLTVERHGKAGHATIEQAQDVQLAAGERRRAAMLTVSFAPGDSLTATATLAVDGAVISTATTSAGATEAAGTGDPR